eukprot:TRINITY_DN19870_c0_g2_i1.p1 TRINITY_DN19870_c0_g2~~TRINITY_DN19870_c0_g2_i1.p1  ORF type:complete len:1046 (+),score=301.63 TRINITY_DN19870_c0_g2_i1:77-3139(+)
MASPAAAVPQQAAEEARGFDGLLTALADALPGLLQPPSSTPAAAAPASVGDVCELLQLLPPLLQRDPAPTRVGSLLFGGQLGERGDLFALLFRYLTAPLAHAPGVPAPDEAQRQFTALRVLLLRTLARVISITAPPDDQSGDPAGGALAEAAARAVAQSRGTEVLLGIVCGGAHVAEEAKVAAVECLFVFLMRNAHGKHALISCPGGLSHLLGALRSEPSAMVRNYSAACVRELANAYPGQVASSGFPAGLPDLLRHDSSKDVRVLAMETLDVVLRADSTFLSGFGLKRELAEALCDLLRSDDDQEVRDIACRLLSTIFSQEGRQLAVINSADTPLDALPASFTAHWVALGGYRHMLRAFRHLVQHAPWQLQIGHSLVDNWAAIGALLRALQPGAAPSADDIDAQIPLVELSIALGIVLSQSPHTRAALHRELAGFPAWLPSLRAALLAHLNRAALEYYDGIDIVDSSGQQINSLEAVLWDEPQPGAPRRPKKASVRQIFVSQEERLGGARGEQGGVRPSTQYDDAETAAQKRMRLTFIVLSYAIHLALSPPPPPPAADPAAPRQPSAPLPAPSSATTSSSSSEAAPPPRPPVPAAPAGAWLAPPPQHPAAWQYPASEHSWGPPPAAAPPQGAAAPLALPPQMPAAAPPPWPEAAPPPPPQPRQWAPPPQHNSWGPPPPALPQMPHGWGAGAAAAAPPPPQPASCSGSARHWGPGGGAGAGRSADAGYSSLSMSPRAGALQPLFPSYPSSLDPAAAARAAGRRHGSAPRPQAAPPPPEVFSKFDSALKLAVHFAQYHNRKQQSVPLFRSTPDGYMISQTKARDPWCPVVTKKPLKSWSVRDLREGDLLYFSIPFGGVTVDAVEQVAARCRRHLTCVKRMFLTTPQRQKGRRWFLFDMLNNIVPGIRDILQTLIELLHRHGEENLKFPLLMFREQEMHEGERAVHPGNIVEVIDQIQFYFKQQPGDLAGVNSAYIRDIDARIRALASQEFNGYEDDVSSDSSSDAGPPGADLSSSSCSSGS